METAPFAQGVAVLLHHYGRGLLRGATVLALLGLTWLTQTPAGLNETETKSVLMVTRSVVLILAGLALVFGLLLKQHRDLLIGASVSALLFALFLVNWDLFSEFRGRHVRELRFGPRNETVVIGAEPKDEYVRADIQDMTGRPGTQITDLSDDQINELLADFAPRTPEYADPRARVQQICSMDSFDDALFWVKRGYVAEYGLFAASVLALAEAVGVRLTRALSCTPVHLPGGLFLSYRRRDSSYAADRIYDHLCKWFDRDKVFIDVNSIRPADDVDSRIGASLETIDVFLAIIGREWLTISDHLGHRRLDNPDDYVRIEIERALACGVPILPIFVEEAQMPKPETLPETLKAFSNRQGLKVRDDPDFAYDMERLCREIKRLVAARRRYRKGGTDPARRTRVEGPSAGRSARSSNSPVRVASFSGVAPDESSH